MRIFVLVAVAASGAAAADEHIHPYAGASIEEVFDSNVQNAKGADGVTRIMPRVGLLVQSPTLQLGGEYRLALDVYAAGTADNSVNHRAALFVKDQVAERFDWNAGGVLLVAEDPLLLDRPGVAIPSGGFSDLTLTTGVAWRAARTVTVDANYAFRRSRFDDAGPDLMVFDGDEHRVDGDVVFRLSRRITVSALARWQRFIEYDSGLPDQDAIGVGARLDLQLTRRLHMAAGGGPVMFLDGGTTWFGRVEVGRIGRRWHAALVGLRELYGGTGADQALWADSLSLEGTYQIARHTWVRARAGGYVSGPAPDLPSNVSGLVGHAEVAWMLGRVIRLDFYGEHRSQSADGGIAFGDVQRTVVGVRLSAVAGADLFALGEVP
jgi:hypothetical protein